MPRKRIHELAKELGLETRQFIAKLERVGVTGKNPRSTLTDDEIAQVHAGAAPQPNPALVLGEEKLVAERVVTEVDQNEHLVTSREEVRENRIKPDVIRRRTKRIGMHEESAPPPVPVFTAPSLDESFAAPMPIVFDLPDPIPTDLPQPPAAFPSVSQELTASIPELSQDAPQPPAPAPSPVNDLEALSTDIPEADAPSLPEPVKESLPPAQPPIDGSVPDAGRTAEPPAEDLSVDTPDGGLEAEDQGLTQPGLSPSPPDQPEQTEVADQDQVAELVARSPVNEPPAVEPATPSEAVGPAKTDQAAGLRSARVLGRIDLGKLQEAKPSRPESKVSPPASKPVAFREPLQNGGNVPPSLPKKGKKRRVIRKPELQETPELDIRMTRGVVKKRRVQPGKEQRQTEITTPKASKRVIRISEVITVGDLAKQMGVKAGEVIKKLMGLGLMVTINQVLDMDTAAVAANEFEYTIENVAFDVDSVLEDSHEPIENEGQLETRPPVVTIMGHVDHGKTSLLDTIRQTNVTAHEHGGITQHIGAYSVEVDSRSLTFLDTPGHEAFTAMRARGAEVTDIVTLIVAADDGVMPQTVEAINHARAADVPIIVAINKIDKPGADQDRVKRDLMNHGLLAEDLGGDVIVAPVSALTGEGIPELLEMILLQTDIMELRSHPDKLARGIIVEAKLDRGRGPVATVLVQEGELKIGDPFVCGLQHGRVRAMLDSWGHKVEKASSSMPVEILGLTGVPEAGDSFVVLNDEAKARQVTEHRRSKRRETDLAKNPTRTSLEDFHQQVRTGEVKDIRVIIKGDVQGSIEAVSDALNRLSTDEVKVSILHASPGGITESDVLLATASKGVIIGFNVRAESKAAHMAEREGIEIRLYTVIYELIEDIRAALEGLLEPIYEEKLLGQAEVRQVFTISRLGMIAGCFVNEGRVQRGAQARLRRAQQVVYEGKIATLKRFKDDVREVPAGTECGVGLESCKDIQPGDGLEIYELEQVLRRLEPKPRPEAQARI